MNSPLSLKTLLVDCSRNFLTNFSALTLQPSKDGLANLYQNLRCSPLAASGGTSAQQLVLFALLTLGMLQSLGNGLLSATDAVRVFFHAEYCLFVHKQLRDKTADAIMSHGVQLPDLAAAGFSWLASGSIDGRSPSNYTPCT